MKLRGSVFSLCRLGTFIRRFILVLLLLSIFYILMIDFSVLQRMFYFNPSIRQLVTEFPEKSNVFLFDLKQENNFTANLTESGMQVTEYSILMEEEVRNNRNSSYTRREKCPDVKDNHMLTGKMGQAVLLIEDMEEFEILKYHPDLKPGGRWRPKDCEPQDKVAIIIPYRDRKSHLVRLLDFLIPLLKKQLLDFRFIVTEQEGNDLFNKGRIMNAAFQLAQQMGVDCVIFHDVDMFPQDDRTPYGCSDTPRHLGAFVNTLGYQLWYKEIVGGVLSIRVEHYINVNGYSNMYWAWGGEDDDMGTRILTMNYTIERPSNGYECFSMLKHVKRKRVAAKKIYQLLEETNKRFRTDGLNEKNKWKISSMNVKPLYYHLYVDVGKPPEDWTDA